MDKSFNIVYLFQKFLVLCGSKQMYTYLFSLVILVIIFCYVTYKIKRRRLETLINQFDGPKGFPFVGNVLQFVGCTKGALNKILKLMVTYNNSFKIWVFHKPAVFLTTPEDCRIVAHETLEKDIHYKLFAEAIGDSIVTTRVEKWKKNRRILNPALNPNILSQFFLKIFNKQNIALIKEMKKEVGTGQHFELFTYINQASVKTILETAMGYTDTDDTTERTKFEDALLKTTSWPALRLHKPWLMPSFTFTIYRYLLGYGNIQKTLTDLPLKALRRQRQLLHSQKMGNDNDEGTEKEQTTRNFTDIILNAQDNNHYTEEEMVSEAINIIFAGSETTATTISFCLLMLAIKQDIQNKVYQEVYEIYGDSDRLPEVEDLSKLSYLEQCITETLRKFPVIPAVGRYTHRDIPISNGRIIPAGCSIVLSIYGIHHNPKIYSNPEIWDPNNFSADKIASRHPSSLMTFSTGPRDCLGKKYAMMSMKTQICLLIRNFKFTTDCKMEDIELDISPSLRSANGFPVKLQYRHKESLF